MGWSKARHSLLLTDSGRLFAMGDNTSLGAEFLQRFGMGFSSVEHLETLLHSQDPTESGVDPRNVPWSQVLWFTELKSPWNDSFCSPHSQTRVQMGSTVTNSMRLRNFDQESIVCPAKLEMFDPNTRKKSQKLSKKSWWVFPFTHGDVPSFFVNVYQRVCMTSLPP